MFKFDENKSENRKNFMENLFIALFCILTALSILSVFLYSMYGVLFLSGHKFYLSLTILCSFFFILYTEGLTFDLNKLKGFFKKK